MHSRYMHSTLALGMILLAFSLAFAAGPTFRPDAVLTGSSLAGWHVLGQADWKLQNGELVGTVRPGGTGGWLVLDKSFQDAGFFASFKCPAGCKSGVLLRAENTPQGMKGIYVSLTEGDLVSYRMSLDAQGQELQREEITTPGGSRRSTRSTPPLPAGVSLPGLEQRPVGTYKPGDWNDIDIVLAYDNVGPNLNGARGGITGGPVTDSDGKYGPIALYVGGSGEVRFKNIAYADLNNRQFPTERTSPNWQSQKLTDWYYSYAQSAADINHDGTMDVVAGPYWYQGPNFESAKEIYKPETYDVMTQWTVACMSQFAYDWENNGWPDVLTISGNAGNGVGTLSVNPKGESRRWDKYEVLPSVGNETTVFTDIDGDGKPELIHATQGQYLAYSKPDPSDVTKPWNTKIISEAGPWGINIGHGIGVGDIDGDGLKDYVNAYGWWKQPPRGSSQELWTYHPQEFGRWGASAGGAGGAEIGIFDVNGDGLNDAVTSMEGHGFGLGWYEQKRDGGGKISFVYHPIMENFLTKNAGDVIFTEPHATAFADFDGDGLIDMVTAKSNEHHHGRTGDPDPYGPPLVYLYKLVRNPSAPGAAEFVPELINNRAGVGDHFWVGDLNKDNKPDIVIAATQGVFVLFNKY